MLPGRRHGTRIVYVRDPLEGWSSATLPLDLAEALPCGR